MQHTPVYILWDASHFWGLLVWRAAKAFALPYQIIKTHEIAQTLKENKSSSRVLIVPGGTARLKAQALGAHGRESIRRFVIQGGHYLGFCGGAGLGLSEASGLGLCPWQRAGITDRMEHLISGHIQTRLAVHSLIPEGMESASLPIWWPGRFAPQPDSGVLTLASYEQSSPGTELGRDFWVADIALADVPAETLGDWEKLYGVTLSPKSLEQQPCMVHGAFGQGSYTLSYSHLETPQSPDANRLLAHIIQTLTGHACPTDVPAWDIENEAILWDDARLLDARRRILELVQTGLTHRLLFKRNSWLLGWRTGIPGASLNTLRSALCTASSMSPTPAARVFWKDHAGHFLYSLALFQKGVESYLLAERLASTLFPNNPDIVTRSTLQFQRETLFGKPMQEGGLYAELVECLDELLYRLLA